MTGTLMLYAATVLVVLTALVHDEPKRDDPLGLLGCVWIAMFWLPFLVMCLVRREVAEPDRRR